MKMHQPTTRRIVTAATIVIPALLFTLIANHISNGHHLGLDYRFLHWIHQFSTPLLDRLAVIITDVGSAAAVILITATLVIGLTLKRQYARASLLLFGIGGAGAINIGMKLAFQRVRPSLWDHLVHEASYSFPSGHAMASSAMALCVGVLLWNTRFRNPAIIFGVLYTLVIGLSRMYLGVHYPSDVIAGWCVSTAWVAAVTWVVARYFPHQRSSQPLFKQRPV